LKISVVIPCFRSVETIGRVVSETVAVLESRPGYDYEIILVNDGSPDATMASIREICATNPRVLGIDLSRNFGQACAMMAGYNMVTGDIVVHSDDDGQTPIDHAWNLIDKLQEGHDAVFAKFEEKKNSAFQNFGTWANNIMAEVLIGKPRGLHLGNFWVCKRFVIDQICTCQNPYPYIGGLFVKATLNFGSVSTPHRPRMHGKSTYTFRKMLGLWLNGFTAFSVVPLRAASILGMLIALAGFVFYVIFQRILFPAIPAGYSSIMAVLLFVSGIIMVLLGVIGEYVGRIYLNINKMPQFVIREKVNF
jgi:polyisoprenyl-phosphate glycosyltransferase